MRLNCALLLLLLTEVAHAGGGFIGFDLGVGDLDVNDVQISPDFDIRQSSEDSTFVANFNGGFQFDNGLFLIGATEEIDQINLFGLGDAVEVTVYKIGAGYSGLAAERFRIHGTVGVAFWELEARESFVFNPGPEATGTIDGEDLYFDFGGEYQFNDTISIVFLYNYNDYDFGDATAIRVGMRFRFAKK